MSGVKIQPSAATTTAPPITSPIDAPNARRAASTSRRPMLWPIRMVEAMPKPNTSANIRNMIVLALAVAATAPSPRKRPTQIVLIEPLSD